ncbi:glyoxalase/bleomycin resistance/extradiol dioxygenase family protein [Streptomyces spongiicola]|uniref:Glyoxalase/bleomycin resistance/extradiol dioxygenase family protein n=1 Tax=Streptomyces spongiicola TaxID=1690221 RepID=A0ABM6VBZ0_9ACTN|nr:VOC family protein [Streptomyces spongiicola]AWK11564.1 glyoxalase/bleomycin resistance/extradiol dioxygenase family protein [Streptomyces spongiicola]
MTTEATRRRPGAPCWVSLMVHGLDATQHFYRELFGWDFLPGPQQLGPYVRALLDGREVAGVGRLPADRHLPIAWTPYLASDDVDETAERIRMCGGTIGVGPLDAADAGRLVIAADPEGAVFGAWQAPAHTGTALLGTHGAPVWNELMTRETPAVGKFYESVFGYDLEPAAPAGSDRLTLRLDDRPAASIHGLGRALPRDRGSHWMTYFEVEDPDAVAARVVDLGGHVVREPHEGTCGRQATVADPEGAVFTVVRTLRRD